MREFLQSWKAPRYVGPKFYPPEIIYHAIELISLLPVGKIDSDNTEKLIPSMPHITLFMPHSGVETQPIDYLYRRIGRMPPVWVTKKENVGGNLPSIFGGRRRFIFMDRSQPGPDLYRNIDRVLSDPDGVIGSAWEGTRFGNDVDKTDVKTLKNAESGFVRIAINQKVPILPVVVLGCDQFLSTLDIIKKEKGLKAAIEVYKEQVLRKDKPIVRVRFGPVYYDHIPSNGESLSLRDVKKRTEEHTEVIIKDIVIPTIRSLDPEYPLGYYKS